MSTTDKGRHTAEELKGKVKEGAGKVTGDEQLEASGQGDQAAASVKKAGDRVKDAAADVAGNVSESIGKVVDAASDKIEDAKRRSKDK